MNAEKEEKLRTLAERWYRISFIKSNLRACADELSAILDSPEPDAEPAEIDYLREQLLQRTNEFESLRAENARLAAELAKAREDAERYRWLRDGETDFATDDFPVARMSAEDRTLWGEELDEAVDAAKGEKT